MKLYYNTYNWQKVDHIALRYSNETSLQYVVDHIALRYSNENSL